MSMDQCTFCEKFVDTDYHAELYRCDHVMIEPYEIPLAKGFKGTRLVFRKQDIIENPRICQCCFDDLTDQDERLVENTNE